ncbi:MAG TPA: N-acetyltransferase [Acidimicrobiales bacterium]|jgi:putative acetyltransferase|nr:N-acetyltransferase [Acidimicrobiales bacterium]
MKPVLRAPQAGEEETVLAVVFAAFSSPGRVGDEEVGIVRSSWAAAAPVERLELVADVDGAVAGHVLAVAGRLDGRPTAVGGVAPVCVAPAHQRRGLGTALMTGLLQRAADRRWPLLVLLGEPAFYTRFGFEPAGPYGLTYPPAGAGSPHFMARRLDGYDASLRGTFTYCWEPG